MCVQGIGAVQSFFVEAMVNEASTEKDMQAWTSILRSVFNTLKQTSFTDTAALQGRLFALDVFFRPPVLQKLLVSAFQHLLSCVLMLLVLSLLQRLHFCLVQNVPLICV